MPDNWKATAEFVGILAIVASLMFLALEVRQSRQIGSFEIAASQVEVQNQLRELLLAHAGTWTRGCAGEELSESERSKYAQIFRGYTVSLYWGWVASKDSIVEIDKKYGVNAYAANYHRYPGFASMSDDQVEWFKNVGVESQESVRQFGEAIGRRIVELREIEPNPDFPLAFCGI